MPTAAWIYSISLGETALTVGYKYYDGINSVEYKTAMMTPDKNERLADLIEVINRDISQMARDEVSKTGVNVVFDVRETTNPEKILVIERKIRAASEETE